MSDDVIVMLALLFVVIALSLAFGALAAWLEHSRPRLHERLIDWVFRL